jgi:hemerythrin-like domain-containing protein
MTRYITDYLVQEHQELAHLLNELQEELRVLPLARNVNETVERLRKLTKNITTTLHAHLEEEEQILYPALEDHVKGVAGTLERMRHEHDTGEAAEKAFLQCVERMVANGRNREEVMKSGRCYIQWLRGHLLDENGRLFPMVERGLPADVQMEIRRAMEELSQETGAQIAQASARPAEA